MVLKRVCDDFRSRSRTAVDQDDDRLALGQIARPGVEALGLLGITARVETISPLSRNASETEIA